MQNKFNYFEKMINNQVLICIFSQNITTRHVCWFKLKNKVETEVLHNIKIT